MLLLKNNVQLYGDTCNTVNHKNIRLRFTKKFIEICFRLNLISTKKVLIARLQNAIKALLSNNRDTIKVTSSLLFYTNAKMGFVSCSFNIKLMRKLLLPYGDHLLILFLKTKVTHFNVCNSKPNVDLNLNRPTFITKINKNRREL